MGEQYINHLQQIKQELEQEDGILHRYIINDIDNLIERMGKLHQEQSMAGSVRFLGEALNRYRLVMAKVESLYQ